MRSTIIRASLYSLAVLTLVSGMVAQINAADVAPAPEIDGGSVSLALAALSAGVLILRSRRRVK